jgi:hypothetical protein
VPILSRLGGIIFAQALRFPMARIERWMVVKFPGGVVNFPTCNGADIHRKEFPNRMKSNNKSDSYFQLSENKQLSSEVNFFSDTTVKVMPNWHRSCFKILENPKDKRQRR